MQHVFQTPEPPSLHVEIGSGRVLLDAGPAGATVVQVTGERADEVVVEQRDGQVRVVAPRRAGFFGSSPEVTVRVTLPEESEVVARLGSASLTGTGRLARVRVETGSGEVRLDDVAAEASVKTGSGDITVVRAGGATQLQTGSGDIEVQRLDAPARLSTGSGAVRVGRAAAAVAIKSGSGDLEVQEASADAVLSTASGDVRVGRFPAGQLTAKNVSGDIRIGIPAGVPVWTDITSTTGRVRSTLQSAGQPADGQQYVELRARTVSGDVLLERA